MSRKHFTVAVLAFLIALVTPVLATATPAQPSARASIVVAGGCFWGVQAVFQHTKGVVSATSGYAGGRAITAHYDIVSTGATGHAETVRVVYDPAQVSLDQILDIFFRVAHDPTQLNRQGPDHGTQYRSAVFYSSSEQHGVAARKIKSLETEKVYTRPIVTTLESLTAFYPAEAYHQNYAALHPHEPYILIHDAPKVRALQAHFPQLYMK
jgi:peptide-methionine (S)-S-oxide reductase